MWKLDPNASVYIYTMMRVRRSFIVSLMDSPQERVFLSVLDSDGGGAFPCFVLLLLSLPCLSFPFLSVSVCGLNSPYPFIGKEYKTKSSVLSFLHSFRHRHTDTDRQTERERWSQKQRKASHGSPFSKLLGAQEESVQPEPNRTEPNHVNRHGL